MSLVILGTTGLVERDSVKAQGVGRWCVWTNKKWQMSAENLEDILLGKNRETGVLFNFQRRSGHTYNKVHQILPICIFKVDALAYLRTPGKKRSLNPHTCSNILSFSQSVSQSATHTHRQTTQTHRRAHKNTCVHAQTHKKNGN